MCPSTSNIKKGLAIGDDMLSRGSMRLTMPDLMRLVELDLQLDTDADLNESYAKLKANAQLLLTVVASEVGEEVQKKIAARMLGLQGRPISDDLFTPEPHEPGTETNGDGREQSDDN